MSRSAAAGVPSSRGARRRMARRGNSERSVAPSVRPEAATSFDLAQHRELVVAGLSLRRRRRGNHPTQERFEDRVHERGEIAEGQQQIEDELVESGRERLSKIAKELIDNRGRDGRDERADAQREDG